LLIKPGSNRTYNANTEIIGFMIYLHITYGPISKILLAFDGS